MKTVSEWNNPIYKTLAGMELGAGHTSGIVPVKTTQNYFGKPNVNRTHRIKTIVIEFWFDKITETIKTNVNYFHSDTHEHIHLTGNIMPTYTKYGASVGDIIVFWKSKLDENNFKAELIKKNSNRWNEIFPKINSSIPGGFISLIPPGLDEYQASSIFDNSLSDNDFPIKKRSTKVILSQSKRPPISKAKGDYVLYKNKYKCQINPKHKTFIAKNGHNFMEKHHLIPMKFYDKFVYDLDTISNIVSICPTCHRLLHFGNKKDASNFLKILWTQRNSKMNQANIGLSFNDLKTKY